MKYIFYVICFLFISFSFADSAPAKKKKIIAKSKKIVKPVIQTKVYPIIPKDTIKSLSNLVNSISGLINNPGLAKTNYGIAIYSVDSNKFCYTHNHQLPLIPASVSKLFTTFSTLNYLGSNPQIKTTVYTDASQISSELNGNIYIYGRGDAFLSINDLELIAEKIKNLGIKKINGSVYCDPSFFDKEYNRFKYSGDLDEVEPVAPVTPLSLEKNTITVVASAGAIGGKPVNIQIFPNSSSIIKVNNAIVSAPARRKPSKGKKRADNMINIESDEIYLNGTQSYGDANNDFAMLLKPKNVSKKIIPTKKVNRGGLSISSSLSPEGKQIITVSGSLSANSSVTRYFTIQNSDIYVAGALYDRIRAAGIQIKGGIARKKMSESGKKTIQLVEFSRPFSSMLNIINKFSDNFLAEHSFKLLGGYINHDNNKLGATSYYAKLFDSLKIPFAGCQFNDGSGLSRRNRATTETICLMLDKAHDLSIGKYLDSSLSIAGRDGTLRKRFKYTPAEANLRGKTGTHSNVSALAGYVKSLDGETFAFAFIFNGSNVGLYKQIENTIGTLISQLNRK